MHIPASTYRLQMSPEFTFSDLNHALDYLEKLEISTLYSAPFFQSMEGSTHGYDVTSPFVINTSIGDLEEFRKINALLQLKGMTWLQDIVPNHMAGSTANPWIYSILEHGPDSEFYRFFDINWDYKEWKGKIMAPFLGNFLENVLEKGELKLIFDADGFSFQYYDNRYPASALSYGYILSGGSETSDKDEWTGKFSNLSRNQDDWKELKDNFYQANRQLPLLDEKLNDLLKKFNSSVKLFKKLLDLQYFQPVFWKESERKINFRRFFTINDLICLRMEDQEVFQTYHKFILQLCDEGLFQGLRIDHIDGLFDPKGYLNKLAELLGDDFYVIVEKILEADEQLPSDWKTQGTSGYDFLAMVNNLYTDSRKKEKFKFYYKQIKPVFSDYEQLVYDKKQFILHERMGGELNNLWELLEELDLLPKTNPMKRESGKTALSAFLAGFPVYRIYPEKFPLTDYQKSVIDEAHETAIMQEPDLKLALDYFRSLFSGEGEGSDGNMLYFLKRCQQFTGPLAAKGVEDTTFYLYNLLVSHNEVGDSPQVFGITDQEFHNLMIKRQREFPHTVNTTATHDTKRGEDARMRINVLSEIPEEWFEKVEKWHQINLKVRKNAQVPDKNEEYFIYQSLIGAMSFEDKQEDGFLQRTNDFLQKVLREAKEHSTWADPDTKYEEDVFEFVAAILDHEAFRSSYDSFRKRIAFHGVINSLGQCLIKITAPGIPDVYQGTELWDLSYVDPDNRRPVDYELRKRYLNEFLTYSEKTGPENLQAMTAEYQNGKIKMFTMFRALKERKSNREFFEKAEYIPLKVSPDFADKIVSYARHYQDKWYLVAVPLNSTAVCKQDVFPLNHLWEEGCIELPHVAPKEWVNIYSGDKVSAEGKIPMRDLFTAFPVALLRSAGFDHH